MTRPHINWEINVATMITIAVLFVAGLGAWFAMPGQIMAQVECAYVRKDVHQVQQQAIEDKLDSMARMIKEIARRMK